jgi:hypothetical protein
LLEQLKLLLVIDHPHVKIVLLFLHLVETAELGLDIQRLLNLIGQHHLSNNNIHKLQAFGIKHLVKEIFHLRCVGFTLDLVHLKMGLAPDQDSDTLSDSRLELLIELVDGDAIAEIKNTVIIFHAPEDHSDVQRNEDVVEGWTSSNRELIQQVLLGHQELDLGPRQARDESPLLVNGVKLPMFGNDRIGSLRPKDICRDQRKRRHTYT